jgi:hypothetical protein
MLKRRDGMYKALVLAGLLILSGCSSMIEEQPKTPWALLKQQSRQCMMDMKTDRELKAIANKVTLESYYDRDAYFELLSIKDRPTSKEKNVIKKWASKLERCYRIKAESYNYEPPGVARWSAATDAEQYLLVLELSRGGMSYGEFASKRLEVDTRYRGEIMRAIAADYQTPGNEQQQRSNASPKASSGSSSCGWEGNQWICRSL